MSHFLMHVISHNRRVNKYRRIIMLWFSNFEEDNDYSPRDDDILIRYEDSVGGGDITSDTIVDVIALQFLIDEEEINKLHEPVDGAHIIDEPNYEDNRNDDVDPHVEERHKLVRNLRNKMEKHGSNGTQACHRYPNATIKEIIENPQTPITIAEEIARFGGSKGNLRIEDSSVNRYHSECERELKGSDKVSHKALTRLSVMLKSVVDSDILSNDAKTILIQYYLPKVCKEKSTGDYTNIGQRLLNDNDMRRNENRNSILNTSLNKAFVAIQKNQNGSISKQSYLVKIGDVKIKANGQIDKRSKAVRNGTITFKSDGSCDFRGSAWKEHYGDIEGKTYVPGFVKKDGTRVRGYYKSDTYNTLPSKSATPEGKTHVDGYTKSNGTTVNPYYKSSVYNTDNKSSSSTPTTKTPITNTKESINTSVERSNYSGYHDTSLFSPFSVSSSSSISASSKSSTASNEKTYVGAYTRNDGTAVSGYYKSSTYNTSSSKGSNTGSAGGGKSSAASNGGGKSTSASSSSAGGKSTGSSSGGGGRSGSGGNSSSGGGRSGGSSSGGGGRSTGGGGGGRRK